VWLTTYSIKAYTGTPASFVAAPYAQQAMLSNTDGVVKIVHFVDQACPCTKFSLPHIRYLKQEVYPSVSHVYVNASQPLAQLDEGIATLTAQVPASPSVAIWNASGGLEYFGAYSSGAFCGEGEDMVEYIMKAIARGEQPQWLNQEAVGCMCPWPV